jgi:hypothetical protein
MKSFLTSLLHFAARFVRYQPEPEIEQERMVHKRLLSVLAVSCSSIGMAEVPRWTVSETSGPVQIAHSGITKIAARGLSVGAGDTISTGVGGRAVLVRGTEYMMVASGSRLRLPPEVQATGFTQVVEEFGNVVFMIKKKLTPHFEVKTPYLAAVVKGTTFSVGVTAKGASVQVLEGAVDVATGDGGAHDLLLPGSVAMVHANDLYRMRVETGGVSIILVSPAAPAASNAPVIPTATEPDAAVIAATVYEAPVFLEPFTGGLVSAKTDVPAEVVELASVTRAASEESSSTLKAVTFANTSIAASAEENKAAAAAARGAQLVQTAAQAKNSADLAVEAASSAAQRAADASAVANAQKATSAASSAAAAEAADQAAKAAAKAAQDAALVPNDPAAQLAAQVAAQDAVKAAEDAGKAASDAAKASAEQAAMQAEDAAKAAQKASTQAAAAVASQEETSAKGAKKVADDAAKAAADAAKAAINGNNEAAKAAEAAIKGGGGSL